MKNRFFSVFLAVLVAVVGFAAWPLPPASAAPGLQTVSPQLAPPIIEASGLEVVLLETVRINPITMARFRVRNPQPSPSYISGIFSTRCVPDDNLCDKNILGQWTSELIDSSGQSVSLTKKLGDVGRIFELKGGQSYLLTIAIRIDGYRPDPYFFPVPPVVVITPVITQLHRPQLHNVTFQREGNVIRVRWQSAGNMAGGIRGVIYSFPKEAYHIADLDAGAPEWVIELGPGIYYIQLYPGPFTSPLVVVP